MRETDIPLKLKRVPLEPNLFTIPSSPEEKVYLLASQCKNCGEIIFPSQSICVNCGKGELNTIKLSRKGKITKSTIIRHRAQLYNGPLPYVVAKVEVPEGASIPSVISGWTGDEPPPYGTEVELDLERFEVDEKGNEIMTYVFRPL